MSSDTQLQEIRFEIGFQEREKLNIPAFIEIPSLTDKYFGGNVDEIKDNVEYNTKRFFSQMKTYESSILAEYPEVIGVRFGPDYDRFDDNFTYRIFAIRMETDEERDMRVMEFERRSEAAKKAAKTRSERKKEEQRKEYESLKKKFEG